MVPASLPRGWWETSLNITRCSRVARLYVTPKIYVILSLLIVCLVFKFLFSNERPIFTSRRAPVDVVVAHFDEWKDGAPDWAKSHGTHNYNIVLRYQRKKSNEANFVPNNGFEAGVYLRYVVDHYDKLPLVVAFVQADACGVNMSNVLRNLTPQLVFSAGGYLHLNCDKILNRTLSLWKGIHQRVEGCWRTVAQHFGHNIFDGIPYSFVNGTNDEDGFRVNIVCCACFAVTRDYIRSTSFNTWRSFYEQAIVRGSCVEGQKDMSMGKSETAGAFEHLAHVIFGRKDPLWDPVCMETQDR